jgi:gamma-glutamyltranspeptidase/glutathione hydrolase
LLAAVVYGVPAASFAGDIVWTNGAVAADNPLASEIGVEVLQQGGNAADAAVAVALTLGVVNPFASGIGGGGFALWRGVDGEVVAFNFREVAPAAASRTMYLDENGAVIPGLSTFGGLAVAVPGEVAGLYALHERYGQLPWADVVEPALALARDGFEVGTLLPIRLEGAAESLAAAPRLSAEFSGEGGWVREGEVLRRSGLAEALAAIAAEGPAGFYEGPVAADIVASASAAGGILTLEDLANYTPDVREPVRGTYRGYTLYSMPAPSSGGAVVIAVLAALEPRALGRVAWLSAGATHVILQAFSHSFADRARYLGDDRFVEIPWERIVGEGRIAAIVDAFDPVRTLPVEAYGELAIPPVDGGTSHFSIVDSAGNAVSLTTTINTNFGSQVATERYGIVLNNEMDDFAAAPGVPNAFGLVGNEANAIEPGKSPLSSMSPTIVTRERSDGSEELVGVIGASGGPQIITATILGLVQLIDYGRTPDEVVASPRFHHQWIPFRAFVESTASDVLASALEGYGYEVARSAFGSALQVLWRADGGWLGASDPRKYGQAAGY